MMFKVKEILDITGGELLTNNDISEQFLISTDTRTISQKNIFIPLVGQIFDGHNFIKKALEKGCKGFLINNNHKENFLSCINSAQFVIAVNDTLEAYLKIANYNRRRINPVVIAVTGSSGKTTTKEIIYSVLSEQFKTHKSKLNHNNEIGLCETLLEMPDDTQYLVVEMGMRGFGEIDLLSKYAEPDIAVITNVGTAHIGRLGSIENIAMAKCEIINHLAKNGLLIAYNNDLIKKYSEGWNGKSVYYDLDKFMITNINSDTSEFIYKENNYKLNVSGEYNIINSMAAIEVGLYCSVLPEKIKTGLEKYKPIDNRWQITELKDNVKLINDSYNANPDSVKAAINAVISSYLVSADTSDSKIILVLGDMKELGEYEDFYHKDIGIFLNDKPIFELITVGEKAELIAKNVNNKNIRLKSFMENDKVVKYLISDIKSNSIILLKASRIMRFDKIAEQLQTITVEKG